MRAMTALGRTEEGRSYDNRDVHITVRLKESERESIEMAAAAERMRLSEWVRGVLMEAARVQGAVPVVECVKDGTEAV